MLSVLLVRANCDWTPNSNCLLHKDNKLFVLIDLKGEEAYEVHTADG